MYDIKKEITGEAAGTEEIQSRTVKTGSTFTVTDAGGLVVGSNKVRHTFDIPVQFKGSEPQTSANYGTIYIAPKRCTVTAVKAYWGTEASDSGTLQVERLQGTETKGNGDDLLSSSISLIGTTGAITNGSLTGTTSRLTLEEGDRLGFETTGTLTALADLAVTVELKYDPS